MRGHLSLTEVLHNKILDFNFCWRIEFVTRPHLNVGVLFGCVSSYGDGSLGNLTVDGDTEHISVSLLTLLYQDPDVFLGRLSTSPDAPVLFLITDCTAHHDSVSSIEHDCWDTVAIFSFVVVGLGHTYDAEQPRSDAVFILGGFHLETDVPFLLQFGHSTNQVGFLQLSFCEKKS